MEMDLTNSSCFGDPKNLFIKIFFFQMKRALSDHSRATVDVFSGFECKFCVAKA